jgi:cytochrome c-type biogenesis protein CcmH
MSVMSDDLVCGNELLRCSNGKNMLACEAPLQIVFSACKQFASKLAPTFGAFLAATALCAQTPTPATLDPALEARVKALSAELRCLVCQNQTVADSDAPVARDMREQVRVQLAAGKNEDEVKRYMTERFGDFVLYKPPLKATTMVLWLAPFAALLLGVFLLVRRLRKAPAPNATPALDADARKRAQALLDGEQR